MAQQSSNSSVIGASCQGGGKPVGGHGGPPRETLRTAPQLRGGKPWDLLADGPRRSERLNDGRGLLQGVCGNPYSLPLRRKGIDHIDGVGREGAVALADAGRAP